MTCFCGAPALYRCWVIDDRMVCDAHMKAGRGLWMDYIGAKIVGDLTGLFGVVSRPVYERRNNDMSTIPQWFDCETTTNTEVPVGDFVWYREPPCLDQTLIFIEVINDLPRTGDWSPISIHVPVHVIDGEDGSERDDPRETV